MTVTIRAPLSTDFADIAALYDSESVIEQTSQLPYRSPEYWQKLYSSKGSEYVEVVATWDGKVVGHLGIIQNDNPRRKHVASFGIAVNADFHGKGVGKALMGELVRLADQWLNLVKIELDVLADNSVAIELYKNFGFEIEGEIKWDIFKRGDYHNSYKMGRINPKHDNKI